MLCISMQHAEGMNKWRHCQFNTFIFMCRFSPLPCWYLFINHTSSCQLCFNFGSIKQACFIQYRWAFCCFNLIDTTDHLCSLNMFSFISFKSLYRFAHSNRILYRISAIAKFICNSIKNNSLIHQWSGMMLTIRAFTIRNCRHYNSFIITMFCWSRFCLL